MPHFTEIPCPVDFAQNSFYAFRTACDLAREQRKATRHVLHVVPIPPGPEVAVPFDRMKGRARLRLERLARNRIDPELRRRFHVTTGDSGREVVHLAGQIGADLIVMATYGRRGLRRLLLGSVSRKYGTRSAVPCANPQTKTKTSRPCSDIKPRAWMSGHGAHSAARR